MGGIQPVLTGAIRMRLKAPLRQDAYMADNTPAQHADTAAEAVRALNYTTLAWEAGEGWQHPGDAYSTVGGVSTMAMRLPQALDQISVLIQRLESERHLRSDRGTLDSDLAEVYAGLGEAKAAADALHQALNRAHSGLAGLAYEE
ncbi:hypothetical protein Srufu_080090 (plasmid) [Streptomyces libani subsp. rufus]|nr:hypothetical protein Srufu_080090 [Streptomyces libani subsp. rufus]